MSKVWSKRGRESRPLPLAIVALCAIAGLGPLASCSDGGAGASAESRERAVPVRAATAIEKDVPVQLHAIGTVEAFATVEVKSRVGGEVAQVHFHEGQEVERGDLLFTIDPRPFQAALRQAEANLARDRAQAENAQAELRRMGKLRSQKIVSQEQYDQAQAQAEALRATVKADEAAVESAQLELRYTEIHSPIDGRVGELLVDRGNVVKEDETRLAVVNQIRPIYVDFSVPEENLAEIRRRSAAEPLRVEVRPEHGEGPPIAGTLSFIDNQVDPGTGTVLLKGQFANQDEALWPGQFVDTLLTLSVRPSAVVVPSAAVQAGQQGTYVFAIGPDRTAALRPVRTGEQVGDEVVIEKGIEAGERVVTDGQLQLAPGVPVEVREDALAHPEATSSPVG